MTTKTIPDVKLPTDTRGDNWGYEVAQRMHAAHAVKADRATDQRNARKAARAECKAG